MVSNSLELSKLALVEISVPLGLGKNTYCREECLAAIGQLSGGDSEAFVQWVVLGTIIILVIVGKVIGKNKPKY